MELNERIRLGRTRAGLTQLDVAKRFRISRPTVAQWEAGTHRPDQDKFGELAGLLNVSLDWLVKEAGPGPSDGSKKIRLAPPQPEKFVKSGKARIFVMEWRNFMGVKVEHAARSVGMDPDSYLAFETYPINFTIGQVAALADEFGMRAEQFWFPPPKIKAPSPLHEPARKRARVKA